MTRNINLKKLSHLFLNSSEELIPGKKEKGAQITVNSGPNDSKLGSVITDSGHDSDGYEGRTVWFTVASVEKPYNWLIKKGDSIRVHVVELELLHHPGSASFRIRGFLVPMMLNGKYLPTDDMRIVVEINYLTSSRNGCGRICIDSPHYFLLDCLDDVLMRMRLIIEGWKKFGADFDDTIPGRQLPTVIRLADFKIPNVCIEEAWKIILDFFDVCDNDLALKCLEDAVLPGIGEKSPRLK